jgi:uncharacterized protein (DUF3084 family)
MPDISKTVKKVSCKADIEAEKTDVNEAAKQVISESEKIAIHEKTLKRMEAIDERFKMVQAQLNAEFQLIIESYVDALGLSENQYWMLSEDKKHIEIHEKDGQAA